MILTLDDDDFLAIAKQIVGERKSIEEWAEIESDDMFQRGPYLGGFDATEMAFTFSFFDDDRREFWFQLTLADIVMSARGRPRAIEAQPADV